MQELYTRKALEVLADYCDMVGYDDSWLLQVAAEAVDNGKWELARDAVVLFCSGRELITVVKRATDQIIRSIVEQVNWQQATSYEIEDLVEEIEEELPL
jgi:hypothetical protein